MSMEPAQQYGADRASRSYPSVPPSAAETRQPEIPHQLEKLERTLKGCMQGLDSLGGRLEASVMRGEAASNMTGKEPAAIQATSLGGQLQGLTNIAAEINARIQSMYSRLEV